MPESVDSIRASFAVLVGLALLWTQLWRALLFLRPGSVQVDIEDPGPWAEVPPPLADAWRSLAELGFTPLGTHSERPRFGPPALFYDGVHPEPLVFASLWVHRGRPRLSLLTPCQRGLVVTRDHRAPVHQTDGYRSGSLEQVGPERLLRAHQRRAAELGAPVGPPSLEARLELAQRWYQGPGKAELRLAHAIGLLWATGGLLVVIAGLHALLGR